MSSIEQRINSVYDAAITVTTTIATITTSSTSTTTTTIAADNGLHPFFYFLIIFNSVFIFICLILIFICFICCRKRNLRRQVRIREPENENAQIHREETFYLTAPSSEVSVPQFSVRDSFVSAEVI